MVLPQAKARKLTKKELCPKKKTEFFLNVCNDCETSFVTNLSASVSDQVTKNTQNGVSDLPKTSAQASTLMPGILALLLATVGFFFRKQKQEN
ncbi:LPXTG cell wall anchor domain-containing protein [Leuconostoc pseudomesenteroides]|uniref:LPXTG cell wall anchor domain-containing protein n=1 Tax=Leuconostoc pseudomesenteroides TaxID=33968 RepID=UPI00403751B7